MRLPLSPSLEEDGGASSMEFLKKPSKDISALQGNLEAMTLSLLRHVRVGRKELLAWVWHTSC